MLLVMAACAMLGWGAWQQVVVGMGQPLGGAGLPGRHCCRCPLCCVRVAIGVMALVELVRASRWIWATARRWNDAGNDA